MYGTVTKMLGNGYVEAFCFDPGNPMTRICHIRGKMRKKVWINMGDIVLVSLRDYEQDKGDIILKYSSDEARQLKTYNQLPDSGESCRAAQPRLAGVGTLKPFSSHRSPHQRIRRLRQGRGR